MANAKMLGCATILACVAVSAPAAAIECRGGYQVVQGNLLSTPYCQDALLAKVAR